MLASFFECLRRRSHYTMSGHYLLNRHYVFFSTWGCEEVRVAVCCSVLQCVAVCCTVLATIFRIVTTCSSVCEEVTRCVLRCVAVCCSALQCVAVCCSVLATIFCIVTTCSSVCEEVRRCMLQCVAVCCGVLRCIAVCWPLSFASSLRVLQCVWKSRGACCSVLQCIAVCWPLSFESSRRVLQCLCFGRFDGVFKKVVDVKMLRVIFWIFVWVCVSVWQWNLRASQPRYFKISLCLWYCLGNIIVIMYSCTAIMYSSSAKRKRLIKDALLSPCRERKHAGFPDNPLRGRLLWSTNV